MQIQATLPRSVRNNNPGNIEYGLPWENLASPPTDADGFCRFVTPVWGFRAMCRSYMTKFDREGINTIRKLITQWSPPDGAGNTPASTVAYIAAVSKSSGYGPDDVLALKTWDCCKRIAYAQAAFEAGAPFEAYWKMTDLAEGAFRAGITDAPAPFVHKVSTTIAASGATVAAAAGGVAGVVQTVSPNLPQTHTIQIACAIVAAVFGLIAVFYNAHRHRIDPQ